MTLLSENPDYGFFGTIQQNANADEAWALASKAILAATGCSAEQTRSFLDSSHGRHFADSVANALLQAPSLGAAIITATDEWMGWRITRRMSRETGIPAGLRYLDGLVASFED